MHSTKQQTVIEVLLFTALVALGAATRISLEHLPNFAPVAGLALFAGYFFRSRLVALAVPVGIMLISDAFIGRYAWWQMSIVYGMLALPVAMRGVLRKHFDFSNMSIGGFARSLSGLLGCSLAASLLFFVVTNALCLGWYEPTWAGVATCYLRGLEFFRYTLAGDMVFAFVTFGGYAMAMGLVNALRRDAPEIAVPSPAAN